MDRIGDQFFGFPAIKELNPIRATDPRDDRTRSTLISRVRHPVGVGGLETDDHLVADLERLHKPAEPEEVPGLGPPW